MTEQPPPPPEPTAPSTFSAPPLPAYAPPPGYIAPPVVPGGELGKVRSTGTCILLTIVTLGIYSIVWFYQVHNEMKRHTGTGIGGGIALLLMLASFVVGITGLVLPFLTSGEVGDMQERAGRPRTVSGVTGLWYFPGILLFFIGPIVWFVKTNGGLNEYWRSIGAS